MLIDRICVRSHLRRNKVCLEGTIADADRDDDLKVFLDNEVSCDFSIGA